MKTTQIEVAAGSNPGTAAHIETMLKAIPGVSAVVVELSKGRVTVEHDEVDPQKLKQAIVSAGVVARLIPEDAEVVSPSVPKINH